MIDKTKILVAERSPVSQTVLHSMLSNWDFEVIAASDGVEACALLQAEAGPRLAILDSKLPGMDAVEICRRVRSMSRLDYLMLLTEKSSFEELAAGMDAGADDYITRPFDWQELRARVQVGCRIVKLQERLVRAREELYDQATRDSLTGLWNRVAIIQTLDSELARASRVGSSLAIVMADIDHFKQVNDTYGIENFHSVPPMPLGRIFEHAARSTWAHVSRFGTRRTVAIGLNAPALIVA